MKMKHTLLAVSLLLTLCTAAQAQVPVPDPGPGGPPGPVVLCDCGDVSLSDLIEQRTDINEQIAEKEGRLATAETLHFLLLGQYASTYASNVTMYGLNKSQWPPSVLQAYQEISTLLDQSLDAIEALEADLDVLYAQLDCIESCIVLAFYNE